LAVVVRKRGEGIESLIKRFRKVVQQEGILGEARRRRFYEKPSQVRKRKAARKLRKSRKTTAKDLRYRRRR
jgi:small subunit ribosomal protein S21